MQACKNTYDKETNKVANELNKLGIGKKNKKTKNITGKRQHSLQETVSRCKRERGREGRKVAEGFFKKKKKEKHSET